MITGLYLCHPFSSSTFANMTLLSFAAVLLTVLLGEPSYYVSQIKNFHRPDIYIWIQLAPLMLYADAVEYSFSCRICCRICFSLQPCDSMGLRVSETLDSYNSNFSHLIFHVFILYCSYNLHPPLPNFLWMQRHSPLHLNTKTMLFKTLKNTARQKSKAVLDIQ